MLAKLISIFGWYGVLAILAAYTLLTFEIIELKSLTYQLLNLTGSLGIIAVAYAKRDVQPIVLNAVWAMVAVIAIFQLISN